MSMQKGKSKIISNPTYQELAPINWVQEHVVNKCPYDGPEKQEKEFRRQINLFFWHVLQSSLYCGTKGKLQKFGEVWVPLSGDLGRRELPMVFGCKNELRGPVGPKRERNEKHFSRALEWIVANVMDYKKHVKKKPGTPGRSREFRIKRVCLDAMYPNKPKSSREILELVRLYSPIRVIQERFGRTLLDMLSEAANKPFGPRKHDITGDNDKYGLDPNRDRAARKLYCSVLKKIGPNEIAVEPILDYLTRKSFMGTKRALKQYHQVLSCFIEILSGPVQIVTDEPLVIRYYPAYAIARIGGRLFEKGGGFQSFPSVLKQECSAIGKNWDMVSSQLNIIKKEFADNNIDCEFLDDIYSVNDLVEKLNADSYHSKLPKKIVKICFYGMLFNAEFLSKNPKSNAVLALRPYFKSLFDVYCFIEKWNIDCVSFRNALVRLSNIYAERFRKSTKGLMLECDTGAKYVLQATEVHGSRKVARRTMSHKISGIESKYLFDAILNGGVEIVYSLEHDGALVKSKGDIESTNAKFIVKRFSDILEAMSDD